MGKRSVNMAKPLIGDEEIVAVSEVLRSGMLAQGSRVAEFESAFAEFIGVKHAIATSSGTTALHVALLACKVGDRDEVVTTPFTFIASANAIRYVGAVPVFADIDSRTYNLDPVRAFEAITPATKAILVVHLYGLPANMSEIMRIAQDHDLLVVEDACQAHGASIKGRKVGSIGDVGCFSFYPTKNMTTGEGGIITTNRDDVAERARMLRQHGMRKRYYHEILGYNFRMTDIAAAIGLVQLGRLEKFNRKRAENAAYLSSRLVKIGDSSGIVPPYIPSGSRHVFHQYTVRLADVHKAEERDELRERLKEAGFGSEVYYPVPAHLQECFAEGESFHLPVTELASRQVLSLPIHPSVTQEDLDRIAEILLSD